MSKNKNAPSSTEELLEIIRHPEDVPRDGSAPESASSAGGERPSAPAARKRRAAGPELKSFRLGTPFSKKSTIGVDFGIDGLKLAKAEAPSSRSADLADFQTVPYPEGMSPDSPKFPEFLSQSLHAFLGNASSPAIWAMLPEGKVEIFHIKIPRLPRSKIGEAVFWRVRREKNLDERTHIMDSCVIGDVMDNGVPKILVSVSIAERKDVDRLREIFEKAGFTLAGATVPSLATQNLFAAGRLDGHDGVCGNIFIGREWSRIDIYKDGKLVLIRNVKSGIETMAHTLADAYNTRQHAGDIEMPALSLERVGIPQDAQTQTGKMGQDRAWDVLLAKLRDNGAGLSPGPGSELGQDAVLDLIAPAMNRFIRQIERTFDHFSMNSGGERVTRLFLCGTVSRSQKMRERIAELVRMPCSLLDPFSGGDQAPQAAAVPESEKERLALAPAAALALSDTAKSPNLLCTFRERERRKAIDRSTQAIYAIFLALALILCGVWYWQELDITALRGELAALNKRIESEGPIVREKDLYELCGTKARSAQALRQTGQTFQGVAVLGEVARLTPPRIRLVRLELEGIDSPPVKPAKASDASGGSGKLVLEGFVRGDARTFDAALSSYLLKLELSPLFSMPEVTRNSMGTMEQEGEVESFVLHVGLN